MVFSRSVLVLGSLCCGALASSCGAAHKETDSSHLFPDDGLHDTGPGGPPSETVAAPVTDLSREKVSATVDAGFGRFLATVEVEASVLEGKFQGFRIVRFLNPEDWRGVGLAPGDVVTRVNDQPIERPEQAYAVFASLKTARSLDVAYTREGQAMRLSLPIVDSLPPVKPLPPPSPAGSAPAAAPASAPAPAPRK